MVRRANDEVVLEIMDYQHNTRDRSLGLFKIDLKDLIAVDEDKKVTSKATVLREDNLISESGKARKGRLLWEAKFIPSLKLKNVKFDTTPPSDLPASSERQDKEVTDAASMTEPSDTSVEMQRMPTTTSSSSLAKQLLRRSITSASTRPGVEPQSPTTADAEAYVRQRTNSAAGSFHSVRSVATAQTAETSATASGAITLTTEELMSFSVLRSALAEHVDG